jgi:outer membrane protein assembly factor BamB
MFGGSPGRNMVNHTDRYPLAWREVDKPVGTLWKADLGSRAYGGPVVAAGKVFVGTNNSRPRNKRDWGRNAQGEAERLDKGVLMCFDQPTGRFLWQAVFDKLETGQANDWPDEGLCSYPSVDGGRLYFVTNRCTVVCADVNGLADGRQGAVARPKYADPTDADIFWEYDMRKELNVFSHNMSACHPLIVGDLLFVCTGNGVDEGHFHIPSPDAPSFIALNKHTGELIWKNNAPGKGILHGQWASPAYAADPVPQVIFPGGDGWIRAFDPPTGRLLWQFDGNVTGGVYELGGTGNKNDFIAAPVVYDGRVYIGTGQDPEHTDGIGRLSCFDLTRAVEGGARNKDRDVSPELLVRREKQPDGTFWTETRPNPNSAAVWVYGGLESRPFVTRDFRFGRTMCTACIVDDLLYIGELAGYVHCFSARTGEHYWQYDTKSSMWGSCYYVDGRILIANDNGDLYVFKHDPKPEVIDEIAAAAPDRKTARAFWLAKRKEVEKKYLLARTEFDAPIRTTPCVAGGGLYVMTEKTLYAIGTR